MSDILNKDEVAALLDCEPATVEEKARKGELPGVKIGRSWRFPREALMRRLNEMAMSSRPSAVRTATQRPVPARRPAPILPALPS